MVLQRVTRPHPPNGLIAEGTFGRAGEDAEKREVHAIRHLKHGCGLAVWCANRSVYWSRQVPKAGSQSRITVLLSLPGW